MINTLGAHLLILLSSSGSVTVQEMSSYDSCRAAVILLESVRSVSGFCIAKEIK